MADSALPTTPPAAPKSSGKVVALPAKVLQKFAIDKLSGRLTITDPNDSSVAWRIYLGNGQIHYASSAMGQAERLSYLLQRYCPELANSSLPADITDYQFICQQWQSGYLSLQQLRQILLQFSQEALVQLLSLPQATVQFERTVGLDQLILSVPLKQLILPLRTLINQWLQIRPTVSSPFQRPHIISSEQFSQVLWLQSEKLHSLQALEEALGQNDCLYQVARKTNLEVVELIALLQPLIQQKAVGLHPYVPAQDERPIVACIDDSKTVQRNVRLILETSGYHVLELTEPARALTTLVRQPPALVLMDISMPDIDGYELCRMLRQSNLLKDVPIVMLTGRDGLIDRLRARMVGATDYLTKPFNPQDLLSVAERLIHRSQVEVS